LSASIFSVFKFARWKLGEFLDACGRRLVIERLGQHTEN
jgi:hypothetical protein